MERAPSFVATCNLKPSCTRSQKRSRDDSTPTGKTPLQRSKQPMISGTGSVHELTRTRWSEKEKELVFQFVRSHGDPQQENITAYWMRCSEFLKFRLGSTRSGKSCRTCYDRELAFKGGKQHVVERKDASCQTEISLPSSCCRKETIQGNHRDWSYIPGSFMELRPDSLVTPITTSVHKLALQRLGTVEKLSETDRWSLLQTILSAGADTKQLAESVFAISNLKSALWQFMLEEIEASASSLTIRSNKSYLYAKDFTDLSTFSFDDVVSEMLRTHPLLTGVLLAVALPTAKIGNAEHTASLLPKLAVIHSILHQARFHELSRLQRVLSVLLMSEHTHQKVYDQLQPIGICLEYSTVLSVVDNIGGHFNSQLIDAVKNGKKFRLIGDNVNFCIGVKYERSASHKLMHHWFASAAIVQPILFDNLSNRAQGKCVDLSMGDILPNCRDVNHLKCDYIVLISRVAKTHMKHLSFIPEIIPHNVQSSLTKDQLSAINTVVPLATEPLNEQYYADVVKILDSYETYVSDVYHSAGLPTDGLHVHIGGDQLTRERFSGAKRLRGYCTDESLSFTHLQPITFELFHLEMKYLSILFKHLFSEKSHHKCTMNGQKIRISRHSVNANVKEHYDADKDFAVSFINSYIVESLREFFGMENAEGHPTKHVPPAFESELEKERWVRQTLSQFIDEMVLDPQVTKDQSPPQENQQQYLQLTVPLPDGQTHTILIPIVAVQKNTDKRATDNAKIYGHNVLQMGLLYKQLLDVIKNPCRERLLYTFKMIMVFIYNHNSRSKYALELLRLICHQQATLSLRIAHESIYGLFVNNLGKFNTHIPADLQMEHIVRRVKGLLKAVGPNKGKETVMKRCKALPGMDIISNNYDQSAGTLKRSQRHKFKSAFDDEKKMIEDLKLTHPFSLTTDRTLEGFNSICLVYQQNMDFGKMKAWIAGHQNTFDHEIGL